jgi:peptide/nickel transport system substrate-binding protein
MQIDPDLASKMKSGGDVTVQLVPSYNFIDLTMNPASQTLNFDFNDKLRQAVRYAVDYDGLIKVVLGGAGLKEAAPIPNGFLGTKDLPLPARDLAKAKQLLADGGQPNGFELTASFATLNVYGVDFVTLMQKIQTDLGDVGIKLKLEPLENSVLRDKARGPGVAMSVSYFAPDHTDTSQYVQFFGMVPGGLYEGRVSKGRATPVINQTEVDLLAKALAAPDLTERGKLYGQIGQEMIKDGYIIALVNPKLVLAYRSNLQGMHYSTCCNLELAVLARK